MIATVLWKEYREARAVWLALLALAALVLLGVPQISSPASHREGELEAILLLWSTVLVWMYGMVCGAMLTAGETEAGTQPFLDALPTARYPLWKAKALAGGLFVLAFALVVPWLSLLGSAREPVWHFVTPLAGGVTGYGWGLLTGVRARSVLAAIALAIVAQVTGFVVVQIGLLLVLAFLSWLIEPFPPQLAMLGAGAACLLAPLPLSGWCYSQIDGQRGAGGTERRGLNRDGARAAGRRVRATLWLTVRQSGVLLGAVVLFAAAAGLLVLSTGIVFWVAVTVIVGAVCGATTVADEQGGAYRMLGDGRYPLRAVWVTKLLLHGAACVVAVLALLVPAWLYTSLAMYPSSSRQPIFEHLFDLPSVDQSVTVGTVVFLPAFYGFTLGLLCGPLCRKTVVAVVVAFGLALPLLALWVPSVLLGGMHGWQLLAPPLLVLLGAGTLLRPWVTDRLASRAGVARVAAVAVAVGASVALGLAYRVVEIPDVPPPAGVDAQQEQMPPDDNAGLVLRSTLARLADRLQVRLPEIPAGGAPMMPATNLPPAESLERVIRDGWPAGADGAEWTKRLNEVFNDPEWEEMTKLAAGPAVMLEDPRRLTAAWPIASSLQVDPVCRALAVRGLQRQAEGDPAAFVRHLDVALFLIRSQTTHCLPGALQAAVSTEAAVLAAVDRWLERIDGRPDLLRQMMQVLDRHRKEAPLDPADPAVQTYLIVRNAVYQPHLIVARGPAFWNPGPRLALSEVVPWERARLDRVVRMLASGIVDPRLTPPWLDPVWKFLRPDLRQLPQEKVRRLTLLDARRLLVALRRYAVERGRAATELQQLVPDYLPSVPTDPYSDGPFRYRLSQGEEIAWRPEMPDEAVAMGGGMPGGAGSSGPPGMAMPPGAEMPPVRMPEAGQPLPLLPPVPEPPARKKTVSAGQGVLWSVGDDHEDNGGKRQGLTDNWFEPAQHGTDLIFLVPVPRPKK
ncbi:MAG: hypothetical protein U0736_26170 [Gemmataceae bacterium]